MLNLNPIISHSITCLACTSPLDFKFSGSYVVCKKCGSAIYISENSAEEDNKNYFNNYQPTQNLRFRSLIFSIFNRIDRLFNFNEFSQYQLILEKIEESVDSASTTVEIGFGGGDELNLRLARGANCYGIDLSRTAVDAYKKKFPHHSQRVVCEAAGKSSISCNLIYSNALFEHLDHPDQFLKATHEQLQNNGLLAIRIPIKLNKHSNGDEVDINYWKPCHRALYSLDGINHVLKRNGFQIIQQATLTYYGYKVMNCLLKAGHVSIQDVRSPYAKLPGLNFLGFLRALVVGLFEKPICVEYAALAVKV